VVHTDDTGWRVGSEPAFLMAFETEAATVYQVRPRHRHEEVQEVIPADYAGVMVTDRGRSYDAQAFDDVRQQKCLAHVQRSLSEVVETKIGRARHFGEGLKARLQDALQLWHAYHDGSATDFVTDAKALREELTYQLRDRPLKDPDNQRLLNELGWHHDRGNLVRFLEDPRIEPTNNRAERALRPAVIARKVSQCSKNSRGTHAFEAFSSVVRTLTKQGIDAVVEALYHLFRFPSIHNVTP
jgi:transposase